MCFVFSFNLERLFICLMGALRCIPEYFTSTTASSFMAKKKTHRYSAWGKTTTIRRFFPRPVFNR